MHKQDPMSHRIIEKRRRDRMNNCLADLSRLIPTTYLKKGRGRVEKTEIIEMAIKHLKHLQAHPCDDPPNCEVAKSTEQEKLRHFRLGFHESMSESVRFLVEIEGFYAGNGACCIRLVNHLQKHFDKLISGSAVTQKYSDLDFREETLAETMDVESVWNVVVPPESMRTFDPQQNGMTECHEWIDDEKAENCEKPLVLKSSNNGDPSAQVTTGSSQLRQMLQSPVVPIERIRSSSTGENNPNRFSSVSRPFSTSSCVAQCQFSATHKAEEVYKFKNNIKKRFKADSSYFSDPSILCDESNKNHAVETKRVLSTDTFTPVGQELEASSNLQPSVSTYRCEISGKPCENLTMTDSGVASSSWDMVETSRTFFTNCGSSNHRQSSGSSSGYSTGTETSANRRYRGEQSPTYYSESPENFSSSSSISPTSQPCSTGIPIFALHPKGTFYIPLTMDATLVAPYVDTFDENQRSLHPISISVNFCNPGRTIEKLPRDTCEQSDFFECERYSKQCGSPDINPVSIPYTIMARN